MKLYSIFVFLFLIALLLFFIGAFSGRVEVMLAGIAMTFILFIVRRMFLPRQ